MIKKSFIFILVLSLVLVSTTSFAFAAATQWDTSDSQHLTGIYNSLVSTSSSGVLRALNSIYDVLTSTTSNYSLYAIASYLYDIRSYLSGSGSSGIATILNNILAEFTSSPVGGVVTHYFEGIYTSLQNVRGQLTNLFTELGVLHNDNIGINNNIADTKTLVSTLNDNFFNNFNKSYSLASWNNPLNTVNWTTYNQITSGSLFDQLMTTLRFMNNNNMGFYYKTLNAQLGVYNESHSGINWLNNQSVSYSARSLADGTFYWLSMIQAPISRLAYVHASDEEIAARQKAEANQTAVVDNFIDPNGSGSLPTSSIGSVSDISNSFKDNFSTDASPTGLFDIFNADHGSWFSQETANQLDTTNINTRSLKAAPSEDFDTPLLDQQIDDIYDALGVKK